MSITPAPRKCPVCGGEIVAVLGRAWCVQPYDKGGCGSRFGARAGTWARKA